MPVSKDKKIAIMSDIARALMDTNSTIWVQSLNAQDHETHYTMDATKDEQFIPSRTTGKMQYYRGSGPNSGNRLHANGVKINDNIQIEKKEVVTKGEKYNISEGFRYVVHTPSGEMSVPARGVMGDSDMDTLYQAALVIYDDNNNENGKNIFKAVQLMCKHLKEPVLRDIVGAPLVKKDGKSKFEKATEKLTKLGITKTPKTDAYIAQKMKESEK